MQNLAYPSEKKETMLDFEASEAPNTAQTPEDYPSQPEFVPSSARPSVSHHLEVEDKVYTVAREVYGAEAVDFTPKAKKDIRRIKRLGVHASSSSL